MIIAGAAGLRNPLPSRRKLIDAGVALSKIVLEFDLGKQEVAGRVKPPIAESMRVRVGEGWMEEAE